jgi:hypothetical protein
VLLALGAIVGFVLPHSESDWFGASVLAPIGIALVIGSVMAIICSAVAFFRKERPAFVSALTAIPALFFLIWVIASIMHL